MSGKFPIILIFLKNLLYKNKCNLFLGKVVFHFTNVKINKNSKHVVTHFINTR